MAEHDRWLGRRRMHLRLRFLQGESTGSYVTRLAARNKRPVQVVLDSMGSGPMPVAPQYTEMYVSRHARERLADLAGRTVAEMQQRLVSLRDEFLMPHRSQDDWEWPWDARAGYVVQACALCAAQRGTRSPAWLILPDPWHVCLRHGRWMDNSRSTEHPYVDLSGLHEVVRAQQRLNRVRKRLGPAARWVQADAYSILAYAGYLEDPAQSRHWCVPAARLGEQRVRPLAQFSRMALLTWDLARLEVHRQNSVLDKAEHGEWLSRMTRRHGQVFGAALRTWLERHPPLTRDWLQLLQDEEPLGKEMRKELRKATRHPLPSPLAPLEDLTCLPWVRQPNSMDRLFL
ncbi:TniQ family protein [Streptomyces chartreusis]|uniref:TniQ family protein n=1 Tax=Streptomyces chartreusis TaxID=1969 RepID=UPI00365935A3